MDVPYMVIQIGRLVVKRIIINISSYVSGSVKMGDELNQNIKVQFINRSGQWI